MLKIFFFIFQEINKQNNKSNTLDPIRHGEAMGAVDWSAGHHSNRVCTGFDESKFPRDLELDKWWIKQRFGQASSFSLNEDS